MTQNDTMTAKHAINPAALTPETGAKMLGLPLEVVLKHISQGAPISADGTINLIHYGAWLNRKINNGD